MNLKLLSRIFNNILQDPDNEKVPARAWGSGLANPAWACRASLA